MTRRGKVLAGVWAVVCLIALAGGVTLGSGKGPGELLSGGQAEAETEPAAAPVDPGVLLASFRVARKKRTAKLLNSKLVRGVKRVKLEKIADCESHGDPRSIGGGGLYRGKYQFDRHTWHAMGGKGDPAKAPEIEQDRRAAELYKVAGSKPWPVCAA